MVTAAAKGEDAGRSIRGFERAERHPALPSSVAELLAPELPSLADEIVSEIERYLPEFDRPLRGPFRPLVRQGVENGLREFVDHITDQETSPERSVKVYRALGRREFLEGRSLDGLQAAYRIGARVAWRRYADVGRRAYLPAETTYVLAEAVFTYVEEVAAHSVKAYAEAQARASGTLERRRHRLLRMLLSDPASAASEAARELAREARWPLPDKVSVVVLEAPDPSTRPVAPALAPAVDPDVLMDLERPEPCLLVPTPDLPGRYEMLHRAFGNQAIVIGPAVPLENAALSLRLARLALSLAARGIIDPESPLRCEDHLATLLLFTGQDVLGLLVEQRLAPFAELRRHTRERLTETLLAWLMSRGNAHGTAEALHVHPQTVRYRMHQIEQVFGTRLQDPRWRYEMELALRAALLLDRAHGAADSPS